MRRLHGLCLLWLVCGGAAHAQNRGFDIDHLQLAVTRGDFLATEGAGRLRPWAWRAGVSFAYMDQPLTVERPDGRRDPLVAARSVMEVSGAVQFVKWFGVGVALPVLVDGHGVGVPSGAALGDLRVIPRFDVVRGERFGLGVLLGLRLPTGDTDHFIGDGNVVFEPRLAAQGTLARGIVRIGGNLGVRVRQAHSYYDLNVGHEVFAKVALAVVPKPWIHTVLELHADTAMGEGAFSRQHTPVEALLGLGGGWKGFRVAAAVGVGVVDGFGAPRARAIVTLGYERPDKPPPPVLVVKATPPRPPAPVVKAPLPEIPDTADDLPTAYPDEDRVRFVEGRIELADPVFFDLNHARVRSRFRPELEELARGIARRPAINLVWIEGHADQTGPERWNLQLSRLRAEAVARTLVAQGIDPARLRPVGFGEARPLVPMPTRAPNERNRRVHFYTDIGPVAPPPAAEEADKPEETPQVAAHTSGDVK